LKNPAPLPISSWEKGPKGPGFKDPSVNLFIILSLSLESFFLINSFRHDQKIFTLDGKGFQVKSAREKQEVLTRKRGLFLFDGHALLKYAVKKSMGGFHDRNKK